jgi:hypothetical protein
MVPSGSEVVVTDKAPGVGPSSPPQPVNPRMGILEKMSAQRMLPITLSSFIEIVSWYFRDAHPNQDEPL